MHFKKVTCFDDLTKCKTETAEDADYKNATVISCSDNESDLSHYMFKLDDKTSEDPPEVTKHASEEK